MTDKNTQGSPRTFYEEISVAGNQLVERIEAMIKEGNIRRLILKDGNGRTILEIPLTLGVVAGTGLAYFALPLALIGAVAAYVAKVHVVIERYENPADAKTDEPSTIIEVNKTDQ
ncbi:MAG: DUF4342 domain-containing protein [Chloroflexota bacterium]